MYYYNTLPTVLLANHICCFSAKEDNEYYRHFSSTGSCAGIVFYYNGIFEEITNEKIEKSYLAGLHEPSISSWHLMIDKGFGIFEVNHIHFVISRLFSVPASERSDQMHDLISLFGDEGREPGKKIMLDASKQQRVYLITFFLEKKLLKNFKHYPVLNSLIRNSAHTKSLKKADQLVRLTFLSERKLKRYLKVYSGFRPNLFSHIIRFQKASHQYGNVNKNLADITYHCTHYNQLHSIHGFKLFSGYLFIEYRSVMRKDVA